MESKTFSKQRVKLVDLRIGYRTAMGKERVVFGPINVELSKAEMVGIIGRNGIGKSTLLRTIAGLQPRLDGKILLDDTDNTKIPVKEMAKLISFVSTEAVITEHLTVSELIAIGRFPYTGWFGKLSQPDLKIVHEASELTGVSHLMQKPVHELSDGERQRVMIARALAQDTPVIILDEPTAFLDLPARYEILRILNDLSMVQQKTILFTTHDLAIAMDAADKLWIMADGNLYQGAPEDLLINKVFHKLFLNSPAEFDSKTFSFRFRRACKNEVTVSGESKYRLLTKKAMERIGFLAIDEGASHFKIYVEEINDAPAWQLHHHDKCLHFGSIYDLTKYLKNFS
jgi:iron complex transport system ATP-binding protein